VDASARREAEYLEQVLSHAGLHYRLADFRGSPVAVLHAASPAFEEGSELFVDAPPGWLRITLPVPLDQPPTYPLFRRLVRVQAVSGFGVGAVDDGRLRLAITLSGHSSAGSPVIAAIQQLHELRGCVLSGRDPSAWRAGAGPFENLTTLESAVLAIGGRMPMTWQPDGSYVGRLEGDDVSCEVRVLSPWPDVFAIEAGLVPPRSCVPDHPTLAKLNLLNATILGGEMVECGGAVIFRWMCPYLWLDPRHVADTVLDTIAQSWRDTRARWY
jgi:hypothetical protein